MDQFDRRNIGELANPFSIYQHQKRGMRVLFIINCIPLTIFLILFDWTKPLFADYSLACNPGYRVSAIKRVNSPRQRGKVGSIVIECQQIVPNIGEIEAKCEPQKSAPECHGETSEGCNGSQWLGGFNVYRIQNNTNAILLDPICCSSPKISVDPISCASERLNFPRGPFHHSISNSDFVYRGIQCWHQYDPEGTILDLIWKIEICQIDRKTTNGTLQNFENCPPCGCHCGIHLCGNGDEPIRVIHKNFLPKCACDCICRYECSID